MSARVTLFKASRKKDAVALLDHPTTKANLKVKPGWTASVVRREMQAWRGARPRPMWLVVLHPEAEAAE